MAKQTTELGQSRYSISYAKSIAQRYKNFALPSAKYYTGFFGFKFIQLMNLPFNQWKAFKEGLIDEDGKELRKPLGAEKEFYNYFVKLVIKLKRSLRKRVPDSMLQLAYDKLFLVREGSDDTSLQLHEFYNSIDNINDSHINNIMNDIFESTLESTFAGDMSTNGSGLGTPATQDVIDAGDVKKKKKKKIKKKMKRFKEFMKDDSKTIEEGKVINFLKKVKRKISDKTLSVVVTLLTGGIVINELSYEYLEKFLTKLGIEVAPEEIFHVLHVLEEFGHTVGHTVIHNADELQRLFANNNINNNNELNEKKKIKQRNKL